MVAARLSRAARLAASHLRPRVPLQLQRDVLCHMPQPGALAEALFEAAGSSGRAGVLTDRGHQLEQAVHETRDGV